MVGILPILLLFSFSAALAQERGWEKGWNETVAAAKKEGKLALYHTTGPFDPLLKEFEKRYPSIKTSSVVGRGNQLAQKILAERRAGRYLVDVYLGAAGTPYRVFYEAKILDPVSALLLLPEVTDPSKWFGRQHHYADPERKYIYVYEGTARSEVTYNKKLVNPADFKSFWDLLNPRWKGKIGAIDPKVTGIATSTALSFFYYNQELGPKFITQLFKDMDLVFSGDTRQLSDWLSVGKVALALFNATEAATARKQGLPVDVFPPDHFKEGTYGAPRQGTISFIQQAPHPNAARLFVNWLLSKEGQTLFQKFFTVPEEEYLPSMRLDVSKEHIPAAYRLSEGTKFLPIYRPEYIDPTPARKVVEDALAGVRR